MLGADETVAWLVGGKVGKEVSSDEGAKEELGSKLEDGISEGT